jgi:hypothetical protein
MFYLIVSSRLLVESGRGGGRWLRKGVDGANVLTYPAAGIEGFGRDLGRRLLKMFDRLEECMQAMESRMGKVWGCGTRAPSSPFGAECGECTPRRRVGLMGK